MQGEQGQATSHRRAVEAHLVSADENALRSQKPLQFGNALARVVQLVCIFQPEQLQVARVVVASGRQVVLGTMEFGKTAIVALSDDGIVDFQALGSV